MSKSVNVLITITIICMVILIGYMIKIFYDIFTYNKCYVAEYDKDFNYDKCIEYIDY